MLRVTVDYMDDGQEIETRDFGLYDELKHWLLDARKDGERVRVTKVEERGTALSHPMGAIR